MKRSNIIGIIAAAVVIIVSVVLISWYLRKTTPMLIQGTVECTTYKASSKVPGRIDDMKVSQGDRVEKGQLLYTLSTPELEAKLQQAEAVKSAAAALDQAALAGARIQQIEAALNMWEKAQAGLELARKTYDRVKNLYDQGVRCVSSCTLVIRRNPSPCVSIGISSFLKYSPRVLWWSSFTMPQTGIVISNFNKTSSAIFT